MKCMYVWLISRMYIQLLAVWNKFFKEANGHLAIDGVFK
jgi:hypothetical protein